MADTNLKKFLDQAGVSTLWSRVAEEVAKVDKKAVDNAADIETMKGQIAALEAGTYDDTAVRALITANTEAIADNVTAIAENADAIALLNDAADVEGSVAHTATAVAAAKVAEIVADADTKYDTLKEIADWILNDTTGAADMANDIASLQQLVGNESVATQIANAIADENLDQYALAADLNDLADRMKAVEDADYQSGAQVEATVNAKITALDLANTYDEKGSAASAETKAKAYADSLAGNYDPAGAAETAYNNAKAYVDAEAAKHETKGAAAAAEIAAKAYADSLAVNYDSNGAAAKALTDAKAYVDGLAGNYDTAGSAAQALVEAKAHTDTEFAKIQALTTAEIEAAIAAAKA